MIEIRDSACIQYVQKHSLVLVNFIVLVLKDCMSLIFMEAMMVYHVIMQSSLVLCVCVCMCEREREREREREWLWGVILNFLLNIFFQRMEVVGISDLRNFYR